MHKKKINNSLSKNFIQGLRPLSTTLPQQIKKVLKKNGFNLSSIVDNWTKIIGIEISNNCYPINITAKKSSKEICLILNVIHGKEIDVEYNKKKIIEKINSYFGYSYIGKIELRIINSRKTELKKIIPEKRIKKNFSGSLRTIENFNLKNKLEKLISAYNEKK